MAKPHSVAHGANKRKRGGISSHIKTLWISKSDRLYCYAQLHWKGGSKSLGPVWDDACPLLVAALEAAPKLEVDQLRYLIYANKNWRDLV